MLIAISYWIIILFASFIIAVGFLMLILPSKGRFILSKAASTNFINYAEITIRLIPAVALILYADQARFPFAFFIGGWIMLITSVVLYIVPRRLHQAYALRSAEILTPKLIRLISPFAFVLGVLIIYNL